MRSARLLTLALIVLAVLTLPGLARAQAGTSVTGTLSYAQRAALPNNALIRMQIAELRAGQAPQLIAEQQFTSAGAQVPIAFSIPYDANRISQSAQYIVQGNISVDGRVRYTTTSQYLVLTGGRPTSNLAVVMSPPPLPVTDAASSLLGVALLLGALAIGAGMLRRRVA